MFNNQRGIATILGIILLALMVGGIAMGIEFLKDPNPATFRTKATTTFNNFNVFNEDSVPNPSPSATPQAFEFCNQGFRACFKEKSKSVTFNELSDFGDGRESFIIPAVELIGDKDFAYLVTLKQPVPGVSLENTQGNLDSRGEGFGETINVAISKEGGQNVPPKEYKLVLELHTGNESEGYKQVDEMNLVINFVASNQ